MVDCDDILECPKKHPIVCGSTCCGILAIVLFFCTFRSLEYTELGLNYSLFSNSIEDKGYTAGRYYLGLGHGFVRFPSTVQTIQFSSEHDSVGPLLRSRTSDGLEVELEVSFQYQLNSSELHTLYHDFGQDYERVFVTSAMDLITTMATHYNATAFFNDRLAISLDMEMELKDSFNELANTNIPFFQLRSVELPADFESAIQDTEVKKQDIQTAEAERQNQEVSMQTKVLQAQQKAQEIALQAAADSESIELQAEAYVKQFTLSQNLQAASLQPIFNTHLQKKESDFLDYLQVRTLRNHPDSQSVVNLASRTAPSPGGLSALSTAAARADRPHPDL
mmetsp:Transcript_57759/g.122871  ORF Transcript_57759/g.122871 Transcript_57759/m.122871 type:complete len:336 (+) Transcript_57759:154-1161(+)